MEGGELGQEEVKVGSDWQFLGSALATCHMPHATRPQATSRVRCGNSKAAAAATADWANKHTHSHTLRQTAIFVGQNSAVTSNPPLFPTLYLSLSLFCQGCQPFGLPITVMIAAHTHTLTHTQKQYEINLPQGKIENEKEPKAKRNIEKEESLVSTCRRLNTLLQPMPIIYIIIQICTI